MPVRFVLPFARAIVVAVAGGLMPGAATAQVFSTIVEMTPPVAPGAREPTLAVLADGRVALGWTEPDPAGFAVRTAIGGPEGFGTPGTVIASDALFVNWADFPSVAVLADGRLAVHWLTVSGQSAFDYDLSLSLSADEGQTWGAPVIPYRDRATAQHGFGTLQPLPDGGLTVVWLDGRAYDAGPRSDRKGAFDNAMQLRAATMDAAGRFTADVALDLRTCSCCQTATTVSGDGAVLVAYRDRTEAEIRDISVLRLEDGTWSTPVTPHPDGWEISGCPVNGPAIDSRAGRTVLAWFTGASDVPAVKVAFSDDDGRSFGPAHRIDRGGGVGRVDALQLEDGSAIVSWVEWTGSKEALFLCRIRPGGTCDTAQSVVQNDAPGSINFPCLAPAPDGVYIAWTQPLPRSGDPERDMTVRMLLARF